MQKTAYEMRISDWSSDVCSSDLPARGNACPEWRPTREDSSSHLLSGFVEGNACPGQSSRQPLRIHRRRNFPRNRNERSEEHTSELQSLMRISYAVFCLKKKKKNTYTQYNNAVHK